MAMKFVAGRAGGGIKSEINVTPLVDVVLVLLIIFMVVGPMLQPGIDVQLPATPKPAPIEGNPNAQAIFSIRYAASPEQGDVYYDGVLLPAGGLETALDELHQRSPGKPILIKSDKRLNFGPVKQVMRACNRRGFESVSLVTSKEGP